MPSHRSVFEQQPVTLSQMLVDRGLDHHLRMLPAETGTDVPWDYIQIGWMDVPYTAAPPIQAVGCKAGGGWREREREMGGILFNSTRRRQTVNGRSDGSLPP